MIYPDPHRQVSYDLQQKKLGKKSKQIIRHDQSDLEKKSEVLEKQLEWEKLRSVALESLISTLEKSTHKFEEL